MAEIDTPTLQKLLASGVDVKILDARGPKVETIIPGATAVSKEISKKDAKALIGSKDALVVTYCSSTKCGASKALAAQLTKLGYKNVLEYPVGIAGWEEQGNKVVKNK
ncbi:hypothetical protein BVX97_02440 [bacterium E08(2017)]|nr:hypothetical protein BVX97_02440 [bacterium E08(2017)]